MKEGWEEKKLGDICDFRSGFAFKSNKFAKIGEPIIRISDIQNEEIDDSNLVYFDPKSYTEDLSKYLIYPDDILIAMSGGTTGKLGINTSNRTFYLNQRVGVFRENKSYLNHRYLYHYLHTKSEESLRIAAGAAQPNLSTAQIKSFIIPVPPLSEQQSIVDYLDSAFAKINAMKANAEKALNEAKALFQASLKEMLEPKEGWEEKTLKTLTTKIGSGATPKGGRKVYIDEGCHLIRSMNVQYNEFKYEDLAHITDEAAEQLKGVEIQENDVLFNITGASIARCCVVPTDALPARVNQHVSILRLKQDVLPRFLSYILNSPKHQRELLEIGEAGSTRQALTKTDLENHVICYPNIDSQTKLLCTLDSLKSKVDRLQENYDKISQECDALKQAILRQVFE